jgi:beta-glucosidase
MKRFFFLLTIYIINIQAFAQIYKNPDASVEQRVDDLLSRMSVAEKIGQMTQGERGSVDDNDNISKYFMGSVLSGGGSTPSDNSPKGWADMYDQMQEKALSTPLGIPILYGIDAVHGNNNLFGAVIFPHNIGLGCTNNPDLVKLAARVTAIEVAAIGIDWTFSPCIAAPQNERWGRTYEGFSENPDIVKVMASATVDGYQGAKLSDNLSIIACAKHYLADGGTTNGTDRGNAEIDETTLRQVHLPAYISAINSNVATVMTSFSSWNGDGMHGNKYLVTDVLKQELGFEGFVVSDWEGIGLLPGSRREKIKAAVEAGVDMAMEPTGYVSFIENLTDLVNSGEITEDRIDDAVRRILKVKFEMGLFEKPFADRTLIDSVGTDYHRDVARKCVRESIVLLKKRDDVLPLSKKGLKVVVAGSNANNIGNQCGGWTLTWQGLSESPIPGTTIFEGLKQVAPANSYSYSADGSGLASGDIAIVVIGEQPYAEMYGDRSSIDGLIGNTDVNAVKTLKSKGIPVVVILVTGRPVNIQSILPYADVILAAWLPGTEGQGVADILFGDYQPSGTLSHTWPQNNSQIPINYGDADYSPLYTYGFGIKSLTNSSPGSTPEYYSALVSKDGDFIDLSFNKKMQLPVGEENSFSIESNGKELLVKSLEFAPGDSFSVRLLISPSILKNETVKINYLSGNFKALDNSLVSDISDYQVFNKSEIISGGASVHNTTISGKLLLYLNFENNSIIAECPENTTNWLSANLYNISGQCVKTITRQDSEKNHIEFKTTGLPQGIYLVRVNCNSFVGGATIFLK